jgi:CheY-like chemotaxis protein
VSPFSVLPSFIETILLAEDEPPLRRLVRRALQQNGYTVLEAGNGAEALAAVEAYGETVHMLVTDVVMPTMGGPELAERLTALLPGLRVLFVSGYTKDDAVLRGCPFLAKPFTPAKLVRKVREVLGG